MIEINEDSSQSGVLSGVPEGYDAQLVLDIVRKTGKPVLFIVRDDRRLAYTREAIRFFSPALPLVEFPAWDCAPYSWISPNPGIVAKRMDALQAIVSNRFGQEYVCLSTVNAAVQKIAARSVVGGSFFKAAVGDRICLDTFQKFLSRVGYSKSSRAMEPGDFAVRGGIIDIFPPGQAKPLRFDFFGDVLDSLRIFRADTQRTVAKIESVLLTPASEVILDGDSIVRFRQSFRREIGAPDKNDLLYHAISDGVRRQGMEHWLPFFHNKLETLFDFLPNTAIVLDEGVEGLIESRWENIQERYLARAEPSKSVGWQSFRQFPCRPEMLYLDAPEFQEVTKGRSKRSLARAAMQLARNATDARGREGRDFTPERLQQTDLLFSEVAAHITEARKSGRVVFACWSDGSRDRIKSLLNDHGVEDIEYIDNFESSANAANAPCIAVWRLARGYSAPGITVVAERDVFGERFVRKTKKSSSASVFLSEAGGLVPGDLVVHSEHGLGRFTGLETITAADAPHDCVAIEYAGGDRLYVPVENAEVISRYGQEEAPLNRLGAAAWQERKARVRKKILDIAEDLIKVAAERALRSAPILRADHQSWEAFSARFQFEETEDQMQAVDELVQDLAAGSPMDRLVCGDVGFGKTEVAMRAAFLAVEAGVPGGFGCAHDFVG